jgi:hypothetical protein
MFDPQTIESPQLSALRRLKSSAPKCEYRQPDTSDHGLHYSLATIAQVPKTGMRFHEQSGNRLQFPVSRRAWT